MALRSSRGGRRARRCAERAADSEGGARAGCDDGCAHVSAVAAVASATAPSGAALVVALGTAAAGSVGSAEGAGGNARRGVFLDGVARAVARVRLDGVGARMAGAAAGAGAGGAASATARVAGAPAAAGAGTWLLLDGATAAARRCDWPRVRIARSRRCSSCNAASGRGAPASGTAAPEVGGCDRAGASAGPEGGISSFRSSRTWSARRVCRGGGGGLRCERRSANGATTSRIPSGAGGGRSSCVLACRFGGNGSGAGPARLRFLRVVMLASIAAGTSAPGDAI